MGSDPNYPNGVRPHLLRDYVGALDALRGCGLVGYAQAAVAFLVAWFIYVPIHELMHAYGCLLAGGEVTRLEIAPEYGGILLARMFPFVVAGSHYAGQLTGFDTHGSDAIYLATVLAPYLLTIFVGVPLLRRAARPSTPPENRPWLFGAALPIAYAPFISIFGDYYEAGSILVSRVVSQIDLTHPAARWRSDDLLKLIGELAERDPTPDDWLIVAGSFVVGLALALLTYHVGALIAQVGARHQ